MKSTRNVAMQIRPLCQTVVPFSCMIIGMLGRLRMGFDLLGEGEDVVGAALSGVRTLQLSEHTDSVLIVNIYIRCLFSNLNLIVKWNTLPRRHKHHGPMTCMILWLK